MYLDFFKTPRQKRFALFLGGCIPARIGLALIAKYLSSSSSSAYLYKLFGLILLLPAFGFLYLYFTGKRQGPGVETQGELIWWNKFRILHGVLYLLFSYNAIFNPSFKSAYLILFLDVFIGLTLFLLHHYTLYF
jgi:hypothetical protein